MRKFADFLKSYLYVSAEFDETLSFTKFSEIMAIDRQNLRRNVAALFFAKLFEITRDIQVKENYGKLITTK